MRYEEEEIMADNVRGKSSTETFLRNLIYTSRSLNDTIDSEGK